MEHGTDTRWFDLGGMRDTAAAQLRGYQLWLGACFGVVVLVGTAVFLWMEGLGTAVLVILGLTVFFGFGIAAAVAWFRRNRKPEPSAGLKWLGIGQTGIWWKSSEGDAHMPWEHVGGVRVHGMFSTGTGAAPRYSFYLDLLHPDQPVVGRRDTGAGNALQRTELPGAVGVVGYESFQIATQIGLAVRAARPDLWRGFTIEPEFGFIVFKSWDAMTAPVDDNMRGITDGLQGPTWDNFGNRNRPPG